MDNKCRNSPETPESRVDSAARLFSEYHTDIQNIIRMFIREPQEQEEIYQELFLYFVRKPVPDEVEKVGAWLYRTILDRVRDRIRRQTRDAARLESYALEQSAQVSETDKAFREEKAERVFRLIRENLTGKEADAFTYMYKDDLEVGMIAQKMDVNSTTVSHYLTSGRRKLRKLFGKDNKISEGETQ